MPFFLVEGPDSQIWSGTERDAWTKIVNPGTSPVLREAIAAALEKEAYHPTEDYHGLLWDSRRHEQELEKVPSPLKLVPVMSGGYRCRDIIRPLIRMGKDVEVSFFGYSGGMYTKGVWLENGINTQNMVTTIERYVAGIKRDPDKPILFVDDYIATGVSLAPIGAAIRELGHRGEMYEMAPDVPVRPWSGEIRMRESDRQAFPECEKAVRAADYAPLLTELGIRKSTAPHKVVTIGR